MKVLPGGLVAMLAASTLAFGTGCTSTEQQSDTGSYSSGHYRIGGRYYHCHPGGTCHNVRHPRDYRGADYRWRQPLPPPPPARARPR